MMVMMNTRQTRLDPLADPDNRDDDNYDDSNDGNDEYKADRARPSNGARGANTNERHAGKLYWRRN